MTGKQKEESANSDPFTILYAKDVMLKKGIFISSFNEF